jgi:RNA polymerase sigma-70 factor (ECF subfamily)
VSAAARREDAPDGFKELLVEVIPALRAFARGLCGRPDLADDLAQEALMKAWAARNSYIPDTNFKAWIFTILRHHYFSLQRKQSRVAVWDPEAADRLLVAAPEQPGNLELAELSRALQTLPLEQREALVLVGAGGFAYEEAAAIAGCAVGTIKSRVARGRKALEALMSAQGDSPGDRGSGEDATHAILDELDRLTTGSG